MSIFRDRATRLGVEIQEENLTERDLLKAIANLKMSVMNTELYDALIAAGAGEEKARAAASAIGDINQLATKADIKIAIAELDAKQMRWVIGAMIAQTGLIVALVKLL